MNTSFSGRGGAGGAGGALGAGGEGGAGECVVCLCATDGCVNIVCVLLLPDE